MWLLANEVKNNYSDMALKESEKLMFSMSIMFII